MNKIGIFICNYNGKNWVLGCVDSLLEQTCKEFDIYLVDNASTDGTVEAIKEKYNDMISILCNAENLGGSGGFDRGLQVGLEKNYEYIVLLDNDIVLDSHVIENMKDYLDKHLDVGIVGAKVMIMDRPDIIQDYGNFLDFEHYRERNDYAWKLDNESLPDVNYCDYVPSCAIMIRASMLRISGTMPVDNFIYYDDIELSHKMVLHGWKIVALGNSRVWHKGGFRKAEVNTFSKYYFVRNRLHFFSKYIEENDIDRFIDTILTELYMQLAGLYNKEKKELFHTMVYALDDFLHNVRGKADEYKIMQIKERMTPFEKIVLAKEKIKITLINNYEKNDELDIFHVLLFIIGTIRKRFPQNKIWISLKECDYTKDIFEIKWKEVLAMDRPEFNVNDIFCEEPKDFDLNLKICSHVKMVDENILPSVYVDRFCNCITSKEDYLYFTSYKSNEQFFKALYRPLMRKVLIRIREN